MELREHVRTNDDLTAKMADCMRRNASVMALDAGPLGAHIGSGLPSNNFINRPTW